MQYPSKVDLLNRMLAALDLCDPEDLSALGYIAERHRDSDEVAPPVQAVFAVLVVLAEASWQERAEAALLDVESHDLVVLDPDEAPEDDGL